jgi:hypothetical protein
VCARCAPCSDGFAAAGTVVVGLVVGGGVTVVVGTGGAAIALGGCFVFGRCLAAADCFEEEPVPVRCGAAAVEPVIAPLAIGAGTSTGAGAGVTVLCGVVLRPADGETTIFAGGGGGGAA